LFASCACVAEPKRPVKHSGMLCPCELLGAVHRGVAEQPPGCLGESERSHIAAGLVAYRLRWAETCLTARQVLVHVTRQWMVPLRLDGRCLQNEEGGEHHTCASNQLSLLRSAAPTLPTAVAGCTLVRGVAGLFPDPRKSEPLFACPLSVGRCSRALVSPEPSARPVASCEHQDADEPELCRVHLAAFRACSMRSLSHSASPALVISHTICRLPLDASAVRPVSRRNPLWRSSEHRFQ